MTRPNKRQAQIRRLAKAKRKLSPITTKAGMKRTRLNSFDNADFTSDPLPRAENMADLSSELSDSDATSSVQSSSEDSSDNSTVIDEPGSQTEATTNRRVCDELKWHKGAGKGTGLRSSYSGSSKSTRKRHRRRQRELERASANTANILGLFKKQQEKKDGQVTTSTSLEESRRDSKESRRRLAIEELEKLLQSPREQVKRYGRVLRPTSDFYRRHLLVRSFFYLQQQKDTLRLSRRREIAILAAANFKRGKSTGRKIVRWEKEWLAHRRIPESKAGKHSACLSWLEDEGVLCAVREFVVSQGEGKCWIKRLMTSSSIANFI
jgi:hypothetical protein